MPASPARSITVLIADDDPGFRDALADTVRSDPALRLVAAAQDAPGAVAAAGELQPDVALVDVRMPGGGREAARGIREVSPETAVLALSAFGDAASEAHMRGAGVSSYLTKGCSVEEILTAIHRSAEAP